MSPTSKSIGTASFVALFAGSLTGNSHAQQETKEQRVFPALVQITASGHDAKGTPSSSSATGFVTSKDGYIVTVTHLLAPLDKIDIPTLKFSIKLGAEKFDLDASAVLKRDVQSDVLVLKVPSPAADRKWLCVLSRKQEESLKVNDTRIFSSGFPDGVAYINTQGVINTLDGPGNTWLTSLGIYGGQSGAPIYTDSGQVLGIAKGEERKLPGMYAFIPIRNVRNELSDYTTDCPSQNVIVAGTQTIDLSPTSLPTPSECVFLGKLSALTTTEQLDDAPFGTSLIATLSQMKEQDRILKNPITLTARTAVNVRSNCPVVRNDSRFYGTVTRVLKSGKALTINAYQASQSAGDTFYWGQVSDPLVDKGNVYLATQQWDSAIKDFDSAIRIDSENIAALRSRGAAHLGKQDWERAIMDYSHTIALEPDNAEDYYNRGISYLAKLDFDPAIRDFNDAIRLRFYNKAWTFKGLGAAYLGKQQWDLAIENYNQAISLEPENAEHHYNRGAAYLGRHDYRLAIRDFNAALRLNFDNKALALYWRGYSKQQTGDLAGGQADIVAARAINPNVGK